MRYYIRHLDSVTSTMDVARDSAESGAPEGTVIVADGQTAGRGRSSHAWYSPPGQSLYASIVLRPALAPAQCGWITMLAALAVRDGIGGIGAGAPAVDVAHLPRDAAQPAPSTLLPLISIKWFNDVLLRGRKVCGILVESSITSQRLDYAVLGIGLNVNTQFDEAPADVRDRATSLLEGRRSLPGGMAAPLDRDAILRSLLARFGERYAQLTEAPGSPAAEYAAAVETLGREVRIIAGPEHIDGRAVRIADDGALIVLTERGERRVGYGDVQ